MITPAARDRSPVVTVLEGIALLLGVWYVCVYIALALIRARYPFELEWMEGAVLEQVRHVAAGHPLYAAPSIEFIPFQYPPLYFYLGALVTRVTGVGFTPLRLLSLAASLGSFAIMFAIVRRESGSARAGFLAVALFAACFRADGAWYDLARIDSLCLLLVLAAAYLVRVYPQPRVIALAVTLLVLACFTKQSAVLIALPLLAVIAARSWRDGLMAATLFAALILGATWILDRAHHGWFVYYVFTMPARMQRIDPVSVNFWREDIGAPLAIAAAMSLGYLLTAIVRSAGWRALFYPALTVGMIGSAWLSMLHAGAYYNNLIPAYAVISILFGLASVSTDARPLVSSLCVIQLLVLFYDPRQQVPNTRSREAGRQLVALIAATPGDVLLPQHGYLAALAGKRSFAHSMAVYDVLRVGRPHDAARLMNEFHQAFAARTFGAVIVDRLDPWIAPDIEREYRHSADAIKDDDAFWPVTGLRMRPEWIYVPR